VHGRALQLVLTHNATHGTLRVQDSGPGIPAEALDKVFEPFYSTREGGLGLGLSLCETLAVGMGAHLSAANRTTQGAEFTLHMPLTSPAA
jgi:signal transduction histidine kinase